jgi:hypothetical protein
VVVAASLLLAGVALPMLLHHQWLLLPLLSSQLHVLLLAAP